MLHLRQLVVGEACCLLFAASCSGGGPSDTIAEPESTAEVSQAVNGGQIEYGYPQVGMVVPDLPGTWKCSGTLIGDRAVLTAKHCVNVPQITPDVLKFKTGTFAGSLTSQGVAAIKLHPSSGVDLAVLELVGPLTDRMPGTINNVWYPPANQTCQIVGFGDHLNADKTVTYGTKYSGTNVTGQPGGGAILTTAGTASVDNGDSGSGLICDGRVSGVLKTKSGTSGGWEFIDVPWILDKAMENSSEPGFAAVSPLFNRVDLFGRGPTGHLLHKVWDYPTWTPAGNAPWEDLDGVIIGQPEVVSRSDNMIDIFVRGTDRHVYYKAWYGGSSWGPWKLGYWDMGGPVGGHVSAVWRGTNQLDLFAIAENGTGILHKRWTPGGDWYPAQTAPWELIAVTGSNYPFTTVKAVQTGTDDHVEVLMVANGMLRQKSLDGIATWSPSGLGTNLRGFGVAGNISVTSGQSGRADVFMKRGDTGVVGRKYLVNGQWFPPNTEIEDHGGLTTAAPLVMSWGLPDRLDIFVRGTTGCIHQQTWYGGDTWYPSKTTWRDVGVCNVIGPPVIGWDRGTSHLFVRQYTYPAAYQTPIDVRETLSYSPPATYSWNFNTLGGRELTW